MELVFLGGSLYLSFDEPEKVFGTKDLDIEGCGGHQLNLILTGKHK